MKFAVVLALVWAASGAFAGEMSPDEEANFMVASGSTKAAAQFFEMSLACKHMSSKDVAAAKEKQRASVISQLPAGDYDKIYTASVAEFKKKWGAMSASEQKKACDKAKAFAKQGR